uniref:Uncharacterized protein n=1 Tax=Quercus lobata TaxID=97700 RepID=A0A7N2LGD4_QUELO
MPQKSKRNMISISFQTENIKNLASRISKLLLSRYNDDTTKASRSGGADPDGNQPGNLYVVIKVHSGTQPGQKVVLKKKEVAKEEQGEYEKRATAGASR